MTVPDIELGKRAIVVEISPALARKLPKHLNDRAKGIWTVTARNGVLGFTFDRRILYKWRLFYQYINLK